MQLMLLIAVIACFVIAGAGAVFSYNDGRKIDDLKVQVSDLSVQIQNQAVNSTQQNPNNGLPIPVPIVTAYPTSIPTPTKTPMPAISVT